MLHSNIQELGVASRLAERKWRAGDADDRPLKNESGDRAMHATFRVCAFLA